MTKAAGVKLEILDNTPGHRRYRMLSREQCEDILREFYRQRGEAALRSIEKDHF